MLKKVLAICYAEAILALMALPSYAWSGPMCDGPFKSFRWMGPAFASAFCSLCTSGAFNNYGNAGFW
jgi:hypothetical protein